MTTEQVANRLVELCRKGEIQKAGDELYADSIVSVEPDHAPFKTANGKAAVQKRGQQFAAMIEQRHGGSFFDPVVCWRFFTVAMILDDTFQSQGRSKIEVNCRY